MELAELYAKYGELMVSQEILTAQINEIKRLLASTINQSREKAKVVPIVESGDKLATSVEAVKPEILKAIK